MFIDNTNFTTKESNFHNIELIGTYSASASLLIKDTFWREGGEELMKEAKELISDQLRKTITADMYDVPFLKLLYRNDSAKEVIIEALNRQAWNIRNNIHVKTQKKEMEELKLLEDVIYQLRTHNEEK